MNLALWIVAGLMAAVFLVAGSTKLFIPRSTLAEAPGGGWVGGFSASFVKVLGALEIAGGVGLVLPAALGVAPFLTPVAASGLAIVMVGAAVVEIRRREYAHAL